MEYFSALKDRKEILSFMTTWMNLEDILPVQQARHRKTNVVSSHSYVESKKIKL
jgi:hypothetical protein